MALSELFWTVQKFPGEVKSTFGCWYGRSNGIKIMKAIIILRKHQSITMLRKYKTIITVKKDKAIIILRKIELISNLESICYLTAIFNMVIWFFTYCLLRNLLDWTSYNFWISIRLLYRSTKPINFYYNPFIFITTQSCLF